MSVSNPFRVSIEKPVDRVIVALDNMNWQQADEVVSEVQDFVGMAKANSIAQKLGWLHAVNHLSTLGIKTMADAKYHDVGSTDDNHCREITSCGPRFVTVHAGDDPKTLQAAVKGRDQGRVELSEQFHYYSTNPNELKNIGGLIGITVLTSLGVKGCKSIYGDVPEVKVLQFAKQAEAAGFDGIVCSGEELEVVRKDSSLDRLVTIVPGIVPEWFAKPEDQDRVVTPTKAVQRGADYLVIGRAITKPPEGMSRLEAAQRIAQELEEA